MLKFVKLCRSTGIRQHEAAIAAREAEMRAAAKEHEEDVERAKVAHDAAIVELCRGHHVATEARSKADDL